MQRNEPDPENLPRQWRPSLVEVTDQGAVFVAHAKIRDDGWLAIREWSGTEVKLPPHRVLVVKRLDTEPVDQEMGSALRVADEEWREKAKNGHGPTKVVA